MMRCNASTHGVKLLGQHSLKHQEGVLLFTTVKSVHYYIERPPPPTITKHRCHYSTVMTYFVQPTETAVWVFGLAASSLVKLQTIRSAVQSCYVIRQINDYITFRLALSTRSIPYRLSTHHFTNS